MKIAALLPTHQHVTDKRKAQRINIKDYFGLRIIINEVQKKYHRKVDIIDYKNVDSYDIILFSCHSISDYFALVYTQVKKLKGKKNQIWIVGGPGVVNINPFIKYFDFICLGRSESLIIELLESIKNNTELNNDSIIECAKYDIHKKYSINYAQKLYTDPTNKLVETMSGCKYNCFYCHYRFSSLPPNLRDEDKKTTMPGNEETFWDLEIKNGSFYTTSLDGLSEKIRYQVNKPITNKMIIDKLVEASKITKKINLKIYFITGYPNEDKIDFSEILQVFKEVDVKISNCKMFINLHFTPFSASPLTPMQWEKVNISFDYRAFFDKLRLSSKYLYQGKNVDVMFMRTTIKPLEVLKRMVVYRSTVLDYNLIEYVACSTEQITHNSNQSKKLELLIRKYDIMRFVNKYEIGTRLATSNIKSWQSEERIIKQAHIYRKSIM